MQFSFDNGTSYHHDDKGTIRLANFKAQIDEELIYVDGKHKERLYTVSGEASDGSELPKITIRADEFAAMSWVSTAWGATALIYPTTNAKELLRTAIQMHSTPETTTIYTSTGWQQHEGKRIFTVADGAIGEDGFSTDVRVELPRELTRIRMSTTTDTRDAINASLAIVDKLPKHVSWPMLAAVYRAPIGAADFAVHVTGRTGTYKSEIASIFQSHFGETTSRELPGSWSSTANAIEALLYRAKNIVAVVDDFIPTGTSWQQRAYQKTADQIFRGQGNQAGRARLTDRSNLQETMYPRGIVISTGEDTPEGHSVRGRMLISELSPGEVDTALLSEAQKARGTYAAAMAAYIRWIAENWTDVQSTARRVSEEIRDAHLGIGHPRTPAMLGSLAAGIYTFLAFAHSLKTVQTVQIYQDALTTMRDVAARQNDYLIAADPADQFVATLRTILAIPAGHVRAMDGGPPSKAPILGWTKVGDFDYKPAGPRLGWIDEQNDVVYLDAAVAYETIRRHSRGTITTTKQTLYKRLREAGILAKTDDARQRNTVRITAQNASRSCLAIAAENLEES
jgi:hypothetical protein